MLEKGYKKQNKEKLNQPINEAYKYRNQIKIQIDVS